MRIAVSGLGIVSAIGRGTDEVSASLRSERSGVGSLTFFETAHLVPVGEVGYSLRKADAELVEVE